MRHRLSVTQQHLALMLNISRSHLAMCETGKRYWPANTMIKFTELMQPTQIPQPIDKRVGRLQNERRREVLTKLHREADYQLETVKR